MVGCVIVHNDKIIAEGFHRKFGEAHAEVNAIEALAVSEEIIKESIIYVSLEPCAHYGKTPPCSDLIIKKGFKELVYACSDPNPLVAGKGIKKIKAQGIKVTAPSDLSPELVKEARFLNRHFLYLQSKPELPWLTAKIALTADGKMIPEPGKPKQITNEESRRQVHRLRSTHQLLLTSSKTVIDDNPQYNVRFSPEALGLADIKDPDVVALYRQNNLQDKFTSYQVKNSLKDFLLAMKAKGYQKIMLEAGPRLTRAFKEENLINELITHQAQLDGDDLRV